jgi:hypothetical protein
MKGGRSDPSFDSVVVFNFCAYLLATLLQGARKMIKGAVYKLDPEENKKSPTQLGWLEFELMERRLSRVETIKGLKCDGLGESKDVTFNWNNWVLKVSEPEGGFYYAEVDEEDLFQELGRQYRLLT